MIKYLLIVSAMIFLAGCSQKPQKTRTSYKGLSRIEFCNLPNYQDKEVFTKAVYSGIMEYWSLSSPTECKNGFQVDLNIKNYYSIPKKFEDVFNKSQSFKYILIEAIGVFETGRPGGYGHLGSNNASFLVTELVEVKGVK